MIASELKQAVRRLRRAPGFSLTVLVLLSLALAAALTLGTAAAALWLRPLPFPDGERLVEVRGWSANMGASLGFAPSLVEPLEALPGVESVGLYHVDRPLELERGGRVAVASIESGLLARLGAVPVAGRLLEDGDAGTDAVLISGRAWRARHGGDPAIVGQVLELGGERLRVVGVLDEGFRFPRGDIELWRPLARTPGFASGPEAGHFGGVNVIASLAPGASATDLGARMEQEFGELSFVAPMREFLGLKLEARSLREVWAGERQGVFGLLAAAVVLVLGALGANLAGLWLERGLRQRREQAIRGALGASGGRMAVGVFAEVLLLVLAATALALALVPPGLSLLQWLELMPARMPWVIGLDAAVVAAALAISLLLAVALAVVPARLAARSGRSAAVVESGSALNLSRGGARLRGALVGVQVALAVALLAGAGLLGRSMLELLHEDLGFDGEGLVLVHAANDPAMDPASASSRFDALQERLSRLAGVAAVSFSNAAPFSGSESVSTIGRFGDPPESALPARHREVGQAYFQAIGQWLVAGRGFSAEDIPAAEPGVIIDARLARQLFGEDAAVGQRLALPAGSDGSELVPARVVGVVATARHQRVDEQVEYGSLFRATAAPGGEATVFLLRLSPGAQPPSVASVEALAREQGLRIHGVDPVLALARATLSDRVPLLVLVLGFSAFGVVLALLGLFAMVAFAVERRRREFGLRLAIGASPRRLGGLALRHAFLAAVPGLVVGLPAALGVGRLLQSRLHGVAPHDPMVLAAVVALVALGVLLAAALPAWRASRVDPQASLRCD